MKDSRKKKLAGNTGVICGERYQTRGEKTNNMKAFLFLSNNRNVAPIRNNQKTLTNFIIIILGHNLKNKDIRAG